MKERGKAVFRQAAIWGVSLLAAISLLGVPAVPSLFAQTIVDEWSAVKTPPAPELKPRIDLIQY